MTDRDDPSVTCTFDLPKTHVADFDTYYSDWQRALDVSKDNSPQRGATGAIAGSIGVAGVAALIGGVVLFVIGVQMIIHNHSAESLCNSGYGAVYKSTVPNGASFCSHVTFEYYFGWVLLVIGVIVAIFGIRSVVAALMVSSMRTTSSVKSSVANDASSGSAQTVAPAVLQTGRFCGVCGQQSRRAAPRRPARPKHEVTSDFDATRKAPLRLGEPACPEVVPFS
jgi:hypothetical protein